MKRGHYVILPSLVVLVAAASVIRRCAIRPIGSSDGRSGGVPGHQATTGASGRRNGTMTLSP